ncbi:phage major capsid protein [Mycolicibacterium sp. Y3]
MKTIEEIQAELRTITDAAKAESRAMSDDEVARYASLEDEQESVRRTEEIFKRQAAYEAPNASLAAAVNVGAARQEDGLDVAFRSFLRTGTPNADITELRAQSAGTDSAGGYLVPQGFRNKLVEVQKSFGGLASQVDQYPTETGNTVEYPSNDDTASSGQITAEGANFAGGSDFTLGTVNLGAFKYTSAGASNAPLKVSVELLQDSAFPLEDFIARKLGERIARKQAVDWVTGVGTTAPFGIARAGLTANATLAAGNAITYAKLLEIEAALDPAYEQNAKWVMSKATWTAIRAVVDGENRPLIQEAAQAGIGAAPARSLLGYEVIIDQAFPSNSTLSAKFAVLGDLREAYVIRKVGSPVISVNPYSSAANGQVEFVVWERADGTVQNRSAYSLAAANAA